MARQLITELVVKSDKFKRGLDQGAQSARGFGSKMQGVGKTLTKTVTPAAIAVGVFAKKAADQWNAGTNAIVSGTGASGTALKGLQGVMKRVAGRVPQDIGTVGQAVADVNTRLGLSGPAAEKMSKKFLDLARITGTDVASAIETSSRLFGDWGVKAKDQAGTLDKVFKASQLTGVSVDELNRLMVQFGAPMRELNFSFDETAALLGKWGKEGVNVELVMGGLKQGLGKLAKAGKDPRKEIDNLSKSIAKSGLTAANKQKVFEIFGARAGIDMAKAIEEGRFELGDLTSQIKDSAGSIDDAGSRTVTLNDRFNMMKNRIQGIVGPYGDMVSVGASFLAGIGPTLMGVGMLTKSIKGSTKAMKVMRIVMMSMGWVLIAAAVIALAIVIIRNWDKIKAVTLAIFNAVKNAIMTAFRAVRDFVMGVFNRIKDHIVGRISAIINFFRAIPGTVSNIFWSVADAIWAPFKWAFNQVAKFWNQTVGKLSFSVPSWVPGIGGRGFSMPQLPHLAKGGIVSKPTVAMIGEAGPEAVVPLSRGGGGLGGPQEITINLIVDGRTVSSVVRKQLLDLKRRNVTVGLT